jgi:YVTN family beta-propeller protein
VAALAFLTVALPVAAHAQTVTAGIQVGSVPYAAVLNPVTNRLYVANGYDGTVSVINAGSNALLGNIPVGLNPTALAVNPVTNQIFVVNNRSDTVSVIDGNSNTVAVTVNTEVSPNSIAVNTVTNQIYVTNFTSNRLTVIDATNGAYATAAVNVGVGPGSVAVNPTTNKIYVVNGGAAPYHYPSVTIIDGATCNVDATVYPGTGQKYGGPVAVNPVTNQIYLLNGSMLTVIDGTSYAVKSLTMGSSPVALAINPATNQIFVANESSNSVTFVDGYSFSVAATVATGQGPFSVAVNPATSQVYTANVTGTATVINGAYNAPINLTTGARPVFVTVNTITDKIYVLNQGFDPTSGYNPDYGTVSVIDGATNNTNVIATGTGPQSVVVNPATNKVYVGNVVGGSVTVFDSASNVNKTVEVGSNPYALAVNPVTNKIYVANSPAYPTPGSVSVIDGASDTVTATVATGTNPDALAVNPVTNMIYVANSSAGSVTIIDGATNQATNLAVGSAPQAVAVNPVTNAVYVANYDSNTVTVIDGPLSWSVNVGANPCALAVNPVTNQIYVVNAGSDNVTVIDGASGTVSGSPIPVGAYPLSIDVNLVTNQFYVSNDDSNTVSAIDGYTRGSLPVNVGVGSYPVYVKVNPTTNKIYVADYYPSGETVIDGATNTTTQISGPGLYANQIAVNPATNAVYVTNYGSNNLTILYEENLQPVLPATTITPLPDNLTTNPAPTFTFTSHSSGGTIPNGVYFQVDTWEGAWTAASGYNPTFSGRIAPLQPGFHILYAYSTNGMEGTIFSTNTPLPGAIQAYGFTLTPPPAAQTISFNPISHQNVSTSLSLNATASSGLPVSFSSSTTSVCTVSGATASFIHTGTCDITASQSGNISYQPATPVTQSFSVLSSAPPTIVSLSPNAGSGVVQTFAAVFSDPNGAPEIDFSTIRILFNTSINGANGCYVLYTPGSNTMYLENNAGNGTSAGLIPGSSASVSNSQCTLSGTGTSVSISGSSLTVKYALTFSGTFIGKQNTYLLAATTNGASANWVQEGTWTAVTAGPNVVSLSPNSGSGSAQVFTAVFLDTKGTADLTTTRILFNTSVAAANGCYVLYTPSLNAMYLENNAGNGTSAALTPGSSSSVSNNQCTLSGAGSSVTQWGNNMTMKYALSFSGTFTAKQNLYLLAGGNSTSTGWVQEGGWTPVGSPAIVSVSPNSGSGTAQVFTAVYSDAQGAADLSTVRILLNTSVSAANGCYVMYSPALNALYLENNAGNGTSAALTPGSSSSVSNSQCTLAGAGSSVAKSGNNMTVKYALSFTGTFTAKQNLYLLAGDGTASSNWVQEGTWTP